MSYQDFEIFAMLETRFSRVDLIVKNDHPAKVRRNLEKLMYLLNEL